MASPRKQTAMASACTAARWRRGTSAARCTSTVPAPARARLLHLIYRSNLRKQFMTKHSPPVNRRILIIDDNRDIHGDFRKVLGGDLDDTMKLAAAELALLGESPPVAVNPGFEMHSAFQGREGVACAQQALAEGRPFAMAFVVMR